MTLKESPNLGEGSGWGRAWEGSHPLGIPEKTSPVNYWITHSSADVEGNSNTEIYPWLLFKMLG